MIAIEGNKASLYQWDLNQRLVLTNLNSIKEGIEVHFSSADSSSDDCLTSITYLEGNVMYADIPNVLLQKSGIIDAYLYLQNEDKMWTEHRTEIIVIARKKPSNYVYTETEIKTYDSLEKRIASLEQIDPGELKVVTLTKNENDEYYTPSCSVAEMKEWYDNGGTVVLVFGHQRKQHIHQVDWLAGSRAIFTYQAHSGNVLLNSTINVYDEFIPGVACPCAVVTVAYDYYPYVSTASAGQTIRVAEVDANGKPTKWEAVDWTELKVTISQNEFGGYKSDVSSVEINVAAKAGKIVRCIMSTSVTLTKQHKEYALVQANDTVSADTALFARITGDKVETIFLQGKQATVREYALATKEYAVSFAEEQNLTDDQKAQARSNIGRYNWHAVEHSGFGSCEIAAENEDIWNKIIAVGDASTYFEGTPAIVTLAAASAALSGNFYNPKTIMSHYIAPSIVKIIDECGFDASGFGIYVKNEYDDAPRHAFEFNRSSENEPYLIISNVSGVVGIIQYNIESNEIVFNSLSHRGVSKTLNTSGYAADSKVTGDAIAALEARVAALEKA